MQLVFLPATAPGDGRFGRPPRIVDARTATQVVPFDSMVWYNRPIRQYAIDWMLARDLREIVLVGFSKSGLGAWNIARSLPERVSGTIIFDAPVARGQRPPWDADAFYADDDAWQDDLPLLTVETFRNAVGTRHSLVLVSGANFHDEMVALSAALDASGCPHTFLPRPTLPHRWDSGWLAPALSYL